MTKKNTVQHIIFPWAFYPLFLEIVGCAECLLQHTVFSESVIAVWRSNCAYTVVRVGEDMSSYGTATMSAPSDTADTVALVNAETPTYGSQEVSPGDSGNSKPIYLISDGGTDVTPEILMQGNLTVNNMYYFRPNVACRLPDHWICSYTNTVIPFSAGASF